MLEILLSTGYLAVAIYWGNRMAVPGAMIRVALVSVLTVFIAAGYPIAYWLLGGLMSLMSLTLVLFAFVSMGSGRAVLQFTPGILGLAVPHLILTAVVLGAAFKQVNWQGR